MASTPKLFQPLTIRGVTLPNRVALSPLCMYSAVDGIAGPWLFAHLSTFARGKVGLVFTEATAVEPRGRITPRCLGIWSDEHAAAIKPTVDFILAQGCVPGIQLAHAGRKASARPPFGERPGAPLSTEADAAEFPPGKWETVAPSAISAGGPWPTPAELDGAGLSAIKQAFVDAAERSVAIGFKVIELHMAHGYLFHSFYSPVSNTRTDSYGGSFENRCRFPLECARAVRAALPDTVVLSARLSCVDGGANEAGESWGVEDTVAFAKLLRDAGVDVIDCSSGGITGAPRFRVTDDGKPLTKESARGPGFQVPYATAVKEAVPEVASMAVGVIVDPHQAEAILEEGKADIVALGRELMYNPFWTLHAAQALGADEGFTMWPAQYGWAVNRRAQIRTLNQDDAAAQKK